MLTLTQPAHAKIVYTPAHLGVGLHRPLGLDLNHDGIVDFTFLNSSGTGGDRHFLAVCQTATQTYKGYHICKGSTNMVREKGVRFPNVAAALPRGAKIETRDPFAKAFVEMGYSFRGGSGTTRWYGPWMNDGKGVKHRYLGLKFNIKGRFHFGWARLTVETTDKYFFATLTGYAYETIPGKAIIAGQTKGPDVTAVDPASLGHLAAGASAIPAWRSGR